MRGVEGGGGERRLPVPPKQHLIMQSDLLGQRPLCHFGLFGTNMKLTKNGSRSLRIFSLPPPPPPPKRKKKSPLYITTNHPLPVLGIEASSLMDRLPPRGHKGECGRVHVTMEKEMPLG